MRQGERQEEEARCGRVLSELHIALWVMKRYFLFLISHLLYPLPLPLYRSVGYKMAEDGGASLTKCPPPVIINITPPPKQLLRKSPSNCSQVPLRAGPSSSLDPHSEDPTDGVGPCILGHQGIGPPDVGPSSGEEGDGDGGVEVTSVQRWLPQLDGEEVCKAKEDTKHPQEVELHPQEISQHLCAGSGGVEVYQEGLVATVGAFQSKSECVERCRHRCNVHVERCGHRCNVHVERCGHRCNVHVERCGYRCNVHVERCGHRCNVHVERCGHRCNVHVERCGH